MTGLSFIKCIHIKQILKSLEPVIAEPKDIAHGFAKELKVQIQSYFAFALDPSSPDFLAEYWTACFFDPVKKGILTPDQISIVKAFLLSEFLLNHWALNLYKFV